MLLLLSFLGLLFSEDLLSQHKAEARQKEKEGHKEHGVLQADLALQVGYTCRITIATTQVLQQCRCLLGSIGSLVRELGQMPMDSDSSHVSSCLPDQIRPSRYSNASEDGQI